MGHENKEMRAMRAMLTCYYLTFMCY